MTVINKDVIRKSIEHYGKEIQSVVCMEELAELTQCISKELRGKSDKDHLTEEIADVLICIQMLKEIYELNDGAVNMIILQKQKRMMERMGLDYQDCLPTYSHSEQDILHGCINLLLDLSYNFKEWYIWVHGLNAIAELPEDERFNYQMSYSEIVRELFLSSTTHSGGSSTWKKCGELDVDPGDYVEFEFETEEEE